MINLRMLLYLIDAQGSRRTTLTGELNSAQIDHSGTMPTAATKRCFLCAGCCQTRARSAGISAHCHWQTSHKKTSGESGVALLRVGRFTSSGGPNAVADAGRLPRNIFHPVRIGCELPCSHSLSQNVPRPAGIRRLRGSRRCPEGYAGANGLTSESPRRLSLGDQKFSNNHTLEGSVVAEKKAKR